MRPSPSTDAETLPQFTVMLTRSGIFHWSFVDRRDTNWAIARVTALAYDDDDGATFDVAERGRGFALPAQREDDVCGLCYQQAGAQGAFASQGPGDATLVFVTRLLSVSVHLSDLGIRAGGRHHHLQRSAMRLPLCVARAAKTQQARTGSHNSGPTTNPRGSRVTDHVGPRHVVGPVLPPRHHGVGDTAFLLTRDLLRQARLHWRAGDEVQIWGEQRAAPDAVAARASRLLPPDDVPAGARLWSPLVQRRPPRQRCCPADRHHEPAGPPHNGQM